MMTCRACRDQLSAYREGELADPLRKELDAHLAGCAECRAQLAELEQMIQQMKGLPSVVVPADFRSRVWQRIEKESGFQRLRRAILEPWYLKLPVEALATAAVILIVVQVVRVAGPEKMATAPPLQEATMVPQELAVMNQDRPTLARKMEPPAGASTRQEMKRAQSADYQADGEMEQAQLAASSAAVAADQAVLRTDIELDLFAPDLAQARKELADLISRMPEASGSFDEEKSCYFVSLPDEQMEAFLVNLFEVGSFEQTRASVPLPGPAPRALRVIRIHLLPLEP